jgi:hypothetical protein
VTFSGFGSQWIGTIVPKKKAEIRGGKKNWEGGREKIKLQKKKTEIRAEKGLRNGTLQI